MIDQKNNLNRIGTEHGVLKGWYDSGNIQSATSNFIDIEQVNKRKEMSLREIVSSLTGGQGFFSCYCKGKCQTKKCACFKGNLKCNSRCHNSQVCLNK